MIYQGEFGLWGYEIKGWGGVCGFRTKEEAEIKEKSVIQYIKTLSTQLRTVDRTPTPDTHN